MNTRTLYRAAYRLDQANRALRRPGRFVKNRAKSKALGAVGFWGLMARWWRA